MPSAGPQQFRAGLFRMVLLAGVWVGLVGLLIDAGEVVTRSAALTHFDYRATSVVVSWRTPELNFVMKAVTWLGSWVALLVTTVIIAVRVITRRLPVLAAVVAVFAWVGEAGGARIGKEVIRRDRPPQAIWLVRAHGWSFPSGHAAAACLAFAVLAVCVAALARRRAVRIVGWLAAGLAVAATAFSRVELGVHWMTDVIASVVFVACWLTAIVISLGGRLRRSEPIADHADGPKPVPRRDETQLDLVRCRHVSPPRPVRYQRLNLPLSTTSWT